MFKTGTAVLLDNTGVVSVFKQLHKRTCLACSGSQSGHRMRFVLPARRKSLRITEIKVKEMVKVLNGENHVINTKKQLVRQKEHFFLP